MAGQGRQSLNWKSTCERRIGANRRKDERKEALFDGRCWLLVPIKGCALFHFKQKKGKGESTCYRGAPVSGVLIDDVFLMAHIIASVLPLPPLCPCRMSWLMDTSSFSTIVWMKVGGNMNRFATQTTIAG